MSLTPPASTPPGTPTTSRREFAAALALTALGACVPGAATTTPAAPPAPTVAPSPTPTPTRAPDPVAPALVAVVTARYGADVVPADQRAAFESAVGRTVELSRRLRGTPVANGVDPFSSLCPTPAEMRRAP